MAHGGLVVLLALALDLLVGDPPGRFHPVAWIGSAIGAGRRALCRGPAWWLLLGGGVLTLAVMALAALAGLAVLKLGSALGLAGLLLEAGALKATISPRGLVSAAGAVAAALGRGTLDEGRRLLGLHLVSRPTADLGEGHVASGAVESVAENLTDALVAPLAFFLVFGLPGSLAYRALNTADAMIGYREGPLEYFGKVAARLDDLANLVPARLAGLALVLAAGSRAPAAWSVMTRDHERTASPNAGWTMAAMAGALGVTLEKPSAYRLGDGPPPSVADIARSVHLFVLACLLSIGILGIGTVVVKALLDSILASVL